MRHGCADKGDGISFVLIVDSILHIKQVRTSFNGDVIREEGKKKNPTRTTLSN